MTSTHTNRLKRSPVSSAPLTPVRRSSTSGARRRRRSTPVAVRKAAHTAVVDEVTVIMSAESESDTMGMATTGT